MARLKYPSTRPPGGLKYVQPETRASIEGDNHRDLMKQVLAHRQYKRLPRATMEEVIIDVERQICARLSSNECVSEGPDDELRPVEETRVLTLGAAMKFTASALKWLASGAQVVPLEQAKKRQAMCLACPLNQPLKSCSCSGFYAAVNALVPASRSDPNLFICSACLCSCKAKTQMPIKMVIESDEGRNIKYPAHHCWVTQEMAEENKA